MTIRLPDGGELDPAYTNLLAFARLGEGDFDAAMRRVESERSARAQRLAEHEREMAEFVASQQARMETQHKAIIGWSKKNL
jgi:hypothetical protein